LAAVMGVLADVIQRGPSVMEAVSRYFNPNGTGGSSPGAQSAVVDERGFRHFPGADHGDTVGERGPHNGWLGRMARQVPEFFRGLAAALQKDLAALNGGDKSITPFFLGPPGAAGPRARVGSFRRAPQSKRPLPP